MGANYFTPENAWRHLFFIHGCTADEFYTDGGLKLNIEQLTQLELKRSGYERVVFYDKDQTTPAPRSFSATSLTMRSRVMGLLSALPTMSST